MNMRRIASQIWSAARRLTPIVLLPGMIVAAVIQPAHAGSSRRVGTDGAPELGIPIGPRSIALGGSVTSDVTGLESIYWNPAGLGTIERAEVSFSHQPYIADLKVNNASIGTKVGGFGVLAFSVKVLSIGDVFVTTEEAPEGTGEVLTPTFSVLGLSWGRQFTDRVRFGMTANYVSESIANNTAHGLAFDFGAQYDTGYHGFKIGMVVKNIGTSMEYSGPGFEELLTPPDSDPTASGRIFSSSSASFEMPSYFQLGLSYDLLSNAQHHLVAVGAFQNNNFSGDELRGGVEWNYRRMFALRGSYFGSFTGHIDPATADETSTFHAGDDIYTGVALGGGVNLRYGEKGLLGVDVAWRPVSSLFEDVVDVGLRIVF
jgi:hypothetical protein